MVSLPGGLRVAITKWQSLWNICMWGNNWHSAEGPEDSRVQHAVWNGILSKLYFYWYASIVECHFNVPCHFIFQFYSLSHVHFPPFKIFLTSIFKPTASQRKRKWRYTLYVKRELHVAGLFPLSLNTPTHSQYFESSLQQQTCSSNIQSL